MSEPTNARRRLSRLGFLLLSPIVAGPVALALLLIAGLLAYCQSRLSGIPDIGDPFDPDGVATMVVDPVQNAAADYEAAFLLVNSTAEPDYRVLDQVLSGRWHDRTPTIDRWLDDNSQALNRWREGTQRDAWQRVPLEDLTMESFSVSVSDAQALSHLAILTAMQSTAAGNLDDAWQWHRAHFRFTRHIGMFGTPIDRNVGAALHARAVDAIVRWAADDRLSDAQLATALAAVHSDYELTPPDSRSVLAEYFITMDQLNHLDEVGDAWQEVSTSFGLTGKRFPNRVERFLHNEPELTRRLLCHQVANLLTFIDQPRADRPVTLACEAAYYDCSPTAADRFLSPDRFAEAVRSSALAGFLLMKRGDGGSYALREEARQQLLETVLAAELFRRVHGTFPATVQDLVDADLIDEIPADPTASTGAALQFERDPNDRQRARIWTVGLNRVDDGGSFEVITGQGPADMGYRIGCRASDE